VLFCILVILTFTSFLGLFYGVFSSIMTAFIGSIILTFILKNLYRLVLISLEPSILPVARERNRKPWAYIVRITVVVLMAAFVSKCMETILFGHWVDDIVEGDLQSYFGVVNFNKFEGSEYFILHMKELNIHYPLINIFTVNMVGLYIIPIIIKHRLKKRNEYYQLRRQFDKQLVEQHYQMFLAIFTRLMESLYRNRYEVDQKVVLKKEFDPKSKRYAYQYKPRYSDEPFNTRHVKKDVKLATTKEFLDNF